MHLILIGYRGTGKTTVAQQLALRLGCPWVDADVEIELQAGKSIAAIFDDGGEEAFRDLEAEVLARLLGDERTTVVAAGGGVVLREANRRLLRETVAAGRGHVVWLRAAAATIHQRLAADPTTEGRRPPLTAAGALEEIVTLLDQRTPLYQRCAELAVDTEGKQPAEIAGEIIEQLGLGGERQQRQGPA